jgi:hypothetical protein
VYVGGVIQLALPANIADPATDSTGGVPPSKDRTELDEEQSQRKYTI